MRFPQPHLLTSTCRLMSLGLTAAALVSFASEAELQAQLNLLRPPTTSEEPAAAPPSTVPPPTSAAQPPADTAATATSAASPALTPAIVEERRKQAEQAADLDADTKTKIADLYRQASEHLRVAEERAAQSAATRSRTEKLQENLASTKQQLEDVKRELDEILRTGRTRFQPSSPPELSPGEASDPDADPELRDAQRQLRRLEHQRSQFQQEIAEQNLQLKELKEQQAKLEQERNARPARTKEIRQSELANPGRVQELAKQLESLPADDPPLLTQAKRTELEARLLAAQRELPALAAESMAYAAEEAANYLTLRNELVAQQAALTSKRLELLEERLKTVRGAAERVAVQVAEAEAVNAQPLLRPFAQENAVISREAQGLTQKMDEAEAERKQARQDLEDLQRKFEQTKSKVDSVGLAHAIGAMLRKERTELPDPSVRRAGVRARQDLIDEAQLSYYEYDDQLSELTANQSKVLENILEAAPDDASEAERAELTQAATRVLDRQKQILTTVRGNYETYFDALVDLSATERQIVELSQEFSTYIDERVLWIRSSKPIAASLHIDDSDLRLFRAAPWWSAGRWIYSDVRQHPVPYASALLVFIALLHLGSRFRKELRAIGEQTEKGSFHRFVPTLRALFLTAMITLPWPALLLFLGWRFRHGSDSFTTSIGYGLYLAVMAYVPLEAFRQLCRPRGVAESHFEWPPSALMTLRRELRSLMVLILPLTFATGLLYAGEQVHGSDLLERIGFVLATLVLAVFIWRIMKPKGGVFHTYLAYHAGGWLDRLQVVWYWAAVASPLILGGMALAGYYYTSTQLAWRLFLTVWLLVGLAIVRSLLMRLLLVHRRRISMQQLRERREAAQAAQAAQPTEATPTGATAESQSTQALIQQQERDDLRKQTTQSRRLLTALLTGVGLVGMWFTWVDVLPALSQFDNWSLWSTTVSATDIDENGTSTTREVVRPVTVVHLAFGLLIFVMTFVGARDIPGAADITVLQRLPLDNSIRYAIKALLSYAIAFIGIVSACHVIGLRWHQVQWLATALTFGLAFGLQEMFANFVAGVILLFERPIRVGDIVTVADVTGAVSRIRMRATTIVDWDRKEFVVPNKEFITGRLLNWTLSDKVNRVVINVGVAYGSDTQRTSELLLQVARDHNLTLDDPAPIVAFDAFGESSLNFCLRCFLPSLESRLQVIHELHIAIDAALREAGIEIAFPQRDLHIRDIPEAWTTVRGNGEARQTNGHASDEQEQQPKQENSTH